jgi:hypothetical protein
MGTAPRRAFLEAGGATAEGDLVALDSRGAVDHGRMGRWKAFGAPNGEAAVRVWCRCRRVRHNIRQMPSAPGADTYPCRYAPILQGDRKNASIRAVRNSSESDRYGPAGCRAGSNDGEEMPCVAWA